MKITTLRRSFLIVASLCLATHALLFFTGCSQEAPPLPKIKTESSTNQPVPIRIGYSTDFTNPILILLQTNGYFKERNASIQLVHFSSDQELGEALLKQEIEAGAAVETTMALDLAVQNPGKIRAIIGEAMSASDYYAHWITLTNSGMNLSGAPDIKSKILAAPTNGEAIIWWQARSWLLSTRLASQHPKKTKQLIRALYKSTDSLNEAKNSTQAMTAKISSPKSDLAHTTQPVLFQKIDEVDQPALNRQIKILFDCGIISNTVDATSFMAPSEWVNGPTGVTVDK